MPTLCILGRQPKLSLAELEARFGAKAIQPLGQQAALVEAATSKVAAMPLGGSLKIAEVLTSTSVNWPTLQRSLLATLPTRLQQLPEGKIKLGLSAYGTRLKRNDLHRTGLDLKKAIRLAGRSVRIIPNQETALSSAQVLHNHLTGPLGVEIVVVARGQQQLYVGQTRRVQDIEAYSARDHGRPKRSGFVGMLPPKLAQMMLNLAQIKPNETVLDPFCGTGVVLQEAALMGCKIRGSDLEPKMIDYSRTNLEWLQKKYQLTDLALGLEQGDARTMQWQRPIDHVVSELFLGQPLTALPSPEKLAAIMQGCNELLVGFLRNLHSQLEPGVRCVIAVPAWQSKGKFLHLEAVDLLSKLGYNRSSFSHASNRDLIYHRSDQTVARELLVLTRK